MPTIILPPILVLDDSEDDLLLIKRLLGKAAIKNPVVTFNDASRLIAYLKAVSSTPDSGLMPCLVLTDLKMAGLDGFEVAKWIRAQKRFARLTIVILSGAAIEKDVKRARQLGVDRYLAKFPTPALMAEIVAEACTRVPKG